MIELKLSIQDTPEYHINNIKRPHLSYMGPILISLLNAIHVFQLCTLHMSNDCLPLFLVMVLDVTGIPGKDENCIL